jgi:quinoprotein glucose dehydrogenase
MDQLLAGKLPPELELELLSAVAHRDSDELKDKLQEFEDSRNENEPLAAYRESLAGGDAERGRAIFFERAEVSCVRCHRANGSGGDVGPNLSGIGAEKAREYLLESIVDPNRVIAKGFDSVALLLDDGKQYSGVLKSETEDQIQIVTPEGKLLAFTKDSIDDRASSKSPMPEDVVKHLSKSDLRDLVEFLSTQKTPPPTDKHE